MTVNIDHKKALAELQKNKRDRTQGKKRWLDSSVNVVMVKLKWNFG